MTTRERSRSSVYLRQIVTGRVRKWQRKPMSVNNMRVNRWSPSEARQTKIVIVSGDDEMEDGGAFENNIPVTRSISARKRQRFEHRTTRSSSRIAANQAANQAAKTDTSTSTSESILPQQLQLQQLQLQLQLQQQQQQQQQQQLPPLQSQQTLPLQSHFQSLENSLPPQQAAPPFPLLSNEEEVQKGNAIGMGSHIGGEI